MLRRHFKEHAWNVHASVLVLTSVARFGYVRLFTVSRGAAIYYLVYPSAPSFLQITICRFYAVTYEKCKVDLLDSSLLPVHRSESIIGESV